jgi:hypothetical protein
MERVERVSTGHPESDRARGGADEEDEESGG